MVRGKHAKPSQTVEKVKKTSTVLAATFATGVMAVSGTQLATAALAAPEQDNHVRTVDVQQESVAQQQSAGVPDVDSTLNPPAPSSTNRTEQAPVTSLQQQDASQSQSAQANHNMYEENPTVPLPEKIAASIPDDADVVGPDYARSADNATLWKLDTGEVVTDPALVGTPDNPPDPLAVSNGRRFLRVPVSRVREEMAQAGRSSQARVQTQVQHNQDGNSTDQAGQAAGQSSQSQQAENSSAASPQDLVNTSAAHEADQKSSDGAVHGTFARAHISGATLSTSAGKFAGSTQATTLQGNQFGAHWGSDTGGAAFKDYRGRTMVYQARLFADISQWQGYPDWNQVKNSGIQGVIIRIGWGTSGVDTSAKYNIEQAKKQGIPFGVYLFSYAENGSEAHQEGMNTVNLLRRYGVSPSDLSLPVYYDLEKYRLSSSIYDSIANNWWSALQAYGYKNLALYANTSWYNTYLNTPNLHAKAGWVAQYGALLQYRNFTSPSKFFGWQYSSEGRVAGIDGNVDLNAFGYTEPVSNPWQGQQGSDQAGVDITRYPQVNIPQGEYYINSAVNSGQVALDVPRASATNNLGLQVWNSNQLKNQKYRFTRNSDGTYTIVNVGSGKALEVSAAQLVKGKNLQQYTPNGTRAQRWILRSAGNGQVYIQSVLGNMVIDLAGGSTANGNRVQLWSPNLNVAQKWILSSSTVSIPSGMAKIQASSASNQVWDIPSAQKGNSVRAQMYRWNRTQAQVYKFTSVGNGLYTIANLHSGKLLEVRYGSDANGASVQQYQANGTQAQKWVVRDGGNGTVMFQNLNSGLFIDIPSANTSNGSQLQQWEGNGSSAQKFRVVGLQASDLAPQKQTQRQKLDELAQSHRNDVKDGTYRFAAASNSQFVLDIDSASTTDHANARLWSQNGTSAQEWNLTHDSYGYVQLTNVGTGKVLTVSSGKAGQAVNVDQLGRLNTTDESQYRQKWIAQKTSRGIVLLSALDSSYALDIDSNFMHDATNVRLWKTDGTPAQAWNLQSPLVGTARADAMAKAFRYQLSDGAHRFASAANQDYVIDLHGGFRNDQTNIWLWKQNGTSAQLWIVSHDSQGFVTLTNASTGKALDVQWARSTRGENIWQYTKNNSRAQKWIAVRVGNAFVFHSAMDPSYVIDLDSARVANGTNIRLWTDNGTAAQRWIG